MIEDVSKDIKACDVEHHIIHFYEKDGVLDYRIADLPDDCYGRESDDPVLKQKLTETVQGELLAHFKYLMFADRAERRGMGRSPISSVPWPLPNITMPGIFIPYWNVQHLLWSL